MSDELKKDQEEFEGDMSSQMYQELLTRSYEKIANLRLALGAANNQEVDLRDRIAASVYPGFLIQSTSSEQAAQDAYRAADKMLRVRESGTAYDTDLIAVLKEMRDSTIDDTTFGRTVRNFLRDK